MDNSTKQKIKDYWSKLKDTTIFKIARVIGNSASIALLITAILFVYQEVGERERTDHIIENLLSVQNSISTRYLGLFPGYIHEVNELLQDCPPKDSIIIFEDVLYYGFVSNPEEFVHMNQLLLKHADEGGHVTIVYYNENGRTFHRINRESLISSTLYAAMEKERNSRQSVNSKESSLDQIRNEDTTLCRKYFALSRDNDPKSFNEKIKRQTQATLTPHFKEDYMPDVLDLCVQIDSIKSHWLTHKKNAEIDFFDYEEMYRSVTMTISSCYKEHGLDLIPMDEYLTMSCWLAGKRAVLAFPSKWSSDEIGFFSQDPAFAQYIKTMLLGVKSSM